MKEEQYIKDGYYRYKDSNDLVHRKIAYKYIYEKNREKYPLPFSKYQVHHKDGNKLNNYHENLELVESRDHILKHIYGTEQITIIKGLMITLLTCFIIIIFATIVIIENLGETVWAVGVIIALAISYAITTHLKYNQEKKDSNYYSTKTGIEHKREIKDQ